MACASIIERVSVAKGVCEQLYPAGVELFQQGAKTADVYLIRHGVVKLVCSNAQGSQVIITLRFKDSLIGAPSVILDAAQPTSAITVSKCNILRIPAEVFLCILKHDNEARWSLIKMHCSMLLEACVRITELACHDSQARLLRLLRQFAKDIGSFNDKGEMQVSPPLTRTEMAETIAVSPEHLSRLFKKLEETGMIRVGKGWIILSPVLLGNLSANQQKLHWADTSRPTPHAVKDVDEQALFAFRTLQAARAETR